jgi:hypothetical protein
MATLDIRQVLLFLAQVPSESHLRLMLQLALASDVPTEELEVLAQKIAEGISLQNLLQQENLLVQLLEADGEVSAAEENMLYETIDQIGLVSPTNMVGGKCLLETLTDCLVAELEGRELWSIQKNTED